MLKRLYPALLLLLVLSAFQNCDMKSSHSEYNSFSSKGCVGVVGEAYKKTYYDTFRTNCTSCHEAGGVAGRPFASANFSEAVASFMSVGRAKIEGNATNPGHKPPNTGPQHQALVTASQTIWAAAEALSSDCFMGDAVRTIEKKLPANVYTTTPGNTAAWPTVTYDLRTELTDSPFQFPINLQVTVEIRRFRVNNVDMGYEVKNPRARVNGVDATERYQIKDIRIVKNGALMNDFTFFSEIDRVFTGATDYLLLNSGNFAAVTPLGPINVTDTVGLQFGKIDSGPALILTGSGGGGSTGGGGGGTVNIPTRVSHADLLSANQIVGVFNRYCVNCHRAGNMSGGLNLQDYNAAFGLRDTIRSRMNNPNMPMPPGGLIPDNGISLQVIDVWLSSGAPQN